MDERNKDQQPPQPMQIKEGAGLEESRLNEEFVDWLKRWSTPILVVIVGIAAAYFGLQQWRAAQERALDQAFTELVAAASAASPDALIAVARDHKGQRAVPLIARLQAADIYLSAARRGVAVGATLEPDGTPQNEDDLLTAEQQSRYLDQAASLYQQVVDGAGTRPTNAVTAMSATFGLAAIAEIRGDHEAAARWYTRIEERARTTANPDMERLARERRESLNELQNTRPLYALAQLPESARPPAADPVFYDSQGNPIRLQRMEGPPPGMLPEGAGIPADQPLDPGALPIGPLLPELFPAELPPGPAPEPATEPAPSPEAEPAGDEPAPDR